MSPPLLGESPSLPLSASHFHELTSLALFSSYIAGVFCAVVSHPADTMVSKLNAPIKAGEAKPTVGSIYGQIGFAGLWGGLGTRIVMIGTLTALQWLIYDSFKVRSFGVVSMPPSFADRSNSTGRHGTPHHRSRRPRQEGLITSRPVIKSGERLEGGREEQNRARGRRGGCESYSLVACYAPRSVQNFFGFCHNLACHAQIEKREVRERRALLGAGWSRE